MDEHEIFKFSYQDLKSLDLKQKEELASKIRQEIIFDVTRNGGHLSSNLGVVELTLSLLSNFDPLKDDILFDVSHQTYTYKILTGRDLSLIRLNGQVCGFSNIDESKYDKYSGGHSGSALSIGLGMSTSKKLANSDSKTVVVVGDASIANGVSFEALNDINDSKYGNIIIVLNDNNMSISSPKGGISKLLKRIRSSSSYQKKASTFKKIFDRKGLRWFYKFMRKAKNLVRRSFIETNIFESLGFTYLGPIDGHNIKKLDFFFNRVKNIDHSSVIHVITKKGKGYQKAENDKLGYYHGISGENHKKDDNYISSSNIASEGIYELLKKDEKAILITPAMIIGGHLEDCFKDFSNRCFDVGISEEHALDLAVGFALKGYHPIVEIYSCFLQRGYDMIINDIARMRLNILIIVERAGLIGEDGSSHQGIFDVDMEYIIPRSFIYQPTSIYMIKQSILNCKFNLDMPIFIRLEKTSYKKDEYQEDINPLSYKLNGVNNSTKLVLACGCEGEELTKLLLKENININIVNLYTYRNGETIDKSLLEMLLKQDEIILYDPTSCSLATYLSQTLLKYRYQGRFITYSIPNKFIKCDTKANQLKTLELDIDTIYNKIKERII